MKPVVASAADDLDAISSSMDISYFLNIFYYGIKVDRSGNLHLGEPKSLTRKLAICADLLSSEIACEAAAIFGAISGPVDRKKLEDFFGQKMPFEGELVEPRPEDNSWLQSSWLEDHISKIRTFVSAVRVHIDRVADARQAKSRLFERAPLEPHATSSLEKFYAKGKPQVIVDPMTRRERAIPRLREISRKVIHIEKPVDESGF
jgi:hypothetical protein